MKIKELVIEHFAGVSQTMNINLCQKGHDNPTSIIIFGENGSGKSSIIDGIEYALTGKIGKTTNKHVKVSRRIHSAVTKLPSKVQVLFDNKTFREAEYRWLPEQEKFRGFFSGNALIFKPYIFRRADLLTFQNVPETERLALFLDFFTHRERLSGQENILDTQEIVKKRTVLKKQRGALIRKLEQFLKLSPNTIPSHPDEFVNYTKEHIFGGLTRTDFLRARNNPKNKGTDRSKNKYFVANNIFVTVSQITKINLDISSLNQEVRNIEKNVWREDKKKNFIEFGEVLKRAFVDVTDGFNSITNAKHIKKISLRVGDLSFTSIEVEVHFSSGAKDSPQRVFSEGYLDLLTLLIFVCLALHLEKNSENRILILDDVFQSVDSGIRFKLLKFILSRFSGWQILISCHDRLWFNQLVSLILDSRKL